MLLVRQERKVHKVLLVHREIQDLKARKAHKDQLAFRERKERRVARVLKD